MMEFFSIDTGLFKLDGGAMFGVVPKSIWNKLNPSDENNMCTWAMRCLLIKYKNRLILIDTGIGNKQSNDFFKHFYLHGNESLEKSIKQSGFELEEITDVILTHLHFDHVGGAVSKNEDTLYPTFKNAKYWVNFKHLNWALNPNPREKASFLKENIQPLIDANCLFDIDSDEASKRFSQIIDFIFVDGHTEKQTLPLIDYKGQKILFAADLIPSVGHLAIPYVMSYDMRPLKTMDEKSQILQTALENNWLLFLEHDPEIEICSLIQTNKGIRADNYLKISELK
jgi:glyoxylase-like metal-dependent hydrolase (beta-lactamase superfamily II)